MSPAIVYFPKGRVVISTVRFKDTDLTDRVYVVSTPIIALYYTQLIGDAKTPPTLLAASSFEGMAVIGLSISCVSLPLAQSPVQMPTHIFRVGVELNIMSIKIICG